MIRRLARYAGVAGVVIVLNFLLPRILPGSPAAGGSGDQAMVLPAQAFSALVDTYHLDAPLQEQFVRYLSELARGELGWSFASHRPVSRIIAERLPWTLALAGGAVVLAAIVGGTVGWAAAWHRRRRFARATAAAVIGLGALPEFMVGMLFIVVFASRLQVFPAGGPITPFGDSGDVVHRVLDAVWHAALPLVTLVITLAPGFALLVENALTPVLAEPYLLVARAKGLPTRRIIWHAMRSALPPVSTLLGIRLGAAVVGAAVIERLFAYPGIGLLLFEGVAARDYPVMQGVVLVSSLAVLGMNFTLDSLAGWLDPRQGKPV